MGETANLLALLHRHYIKPGLNMPGGVFLPEVGQNGNWGAGSRCDAIYAGFTSSSGRILIGHELKTSRADWLNELKKPGKADAWADECHEWWLVVNDPTIVRDGELPAGWGLMVPGRRTKTRMDIAVKAARKDPAVHRPSWDAVRSVLARQDTLRAQAIEAARTCAQQDAWAELDRRVQDRVEHELKQRGTPDAAELADKLKRIETALGGRIDWDAESRGYIRPGAEWIGMPELTHIARAVRAAGSIDRALRELSNRYYTPIDNTKRVLADLERALQELQQADGRQEATA
ncbi:hypothetical protein [Mycolicibacterium conceptionense]|uniref:hypothetical protein n=1 Tax=Mycolicibacterium conceptionense TaxID=451644 RepID=UPI003204B691